MHRIDTEGTFLGTVEESGVNVTQKSSFPQWVGRLKATQKWVDDPDGMKHFGLTEPGYVDWSSYNEDINAFLVLFKSAEDFSKDTALLNYEQLQKALDWDGTEFDSLGDGTHLGKTVMFIVKSEEYEGKTQLKVTWIDSKDASAVRTLKTLDATEVKSLSAKLKAGGLGSIKKPAAAPAKPGAKPAATAPAPAAKPPATKPAPAPAPAPEPAKTETPAPKPAPKGKKKEAAPPPPPPAAEKSDLPKEVSQGDAWEYVCNNKGDNEDSVVEEAWIDACGEVLGDRDQDTATPAEWAKIRDIVIKDLAL